KLVLADDAARVLAGGSCLRAEAGRVGGEADRQTGFLEDLVAGEIRDRDLGSWDKPVGVVAELPARHGLSVGLIAAKQVFRKLGKLAGSEEALRIHHEGRQHLGVAVLLGVLVQHEADQGALQAGPGAHVNGESRATELSRAFEIENAKLFAELPM